MFFIAFAFLSSVVTFLAFVIVSLSVVFAVIFLIFTFGFKRVTFGLLASNKKKKGNKNKGFSVNIIKTFTVILTALFIVLFVYRYNIKVICNEIIK